MRPPPHTPRLREFFTDSRGTFSAFTLVSLFAGITIVTSPLVCRLLHWDLLNRDEIGCLTLLYVISALSDTLLGVFLNKLPGTITLDTNGGPANLGMNTGGVTAEQEA